MTPQTPRPAPIATTNVCKIVIALPKIPYSFLNKRCFYGLSAFPLSFPYYSDLFFYLFYSQGDLIFIFTSFSFLPDHQDFLFKKRKKRAHRRISTCSNAFYSVFLMKFDLSFFIRECNSYY